MNVNMTATVCLGALSFLIVFCLRWPGLLQPMELSAFDWMMRIKAAHPQGHSRIAIIGITEEDIDDLGQWPLTDEQLAELLEGILDLSPRAVGVDLFRNLPTPPGTERLKSVLTSHSEIIMVNKFGPQEVPPPPCLEGTDQVGFSDILVDTGGRVRRGLLYLDHKGTVSMSLALRLALLYLEKEGIFPEPSPQNPAHLKLGPTVVRPFESNDGGYVKADSRGYQFLLNLESSDRPFPVVSYSRFQANDVPADAFHDAVVLIGVMAQSMKDIFYTSFSHGLRGHQHMTGVVLHAFLTDQIIKFGLGKAKPLQTLSDHQELGLIFFWAMSGGLVALLFRSIWSLSLVSIIGASLIGLSACASLAQGLWIPLVQTFLAFALSLFSVIAFISSRESRHRALLMDIFSRHVSPQVAESIWQQREQILKDGKPSSKKLTATVLFSDIRGYTRIAEILGPQELTDWLNSYLEIMTSVVMSYGGVVDDYAGDGIKADFGVPIPRTTRQEIAQDVNNAVRCAMTMKEEISLLNDLWRKKGLPNVGIRIGICTGEVLAGTIGSKIRAKYTTLGDTVNVAARLESFDKTLAQEDICRILISQSCLDYLEDGYEMEHIGLLQLHGKNVNVSVYRILGCQSE